MGYNGTYYVFAVCVCVCVCVCAFARERVFVCVIVSGVSGSVCVCVRARAHACSCASVKVYKSPRRISHLLGKFLIKRSLSLSLARARALSLSLSWKHALSLPPSLPPSLPLVCSVSHTGFNHRLQVPKLSEEIIPEKVSDMYGIVRSMDSS